MLWIILSYCYYITISWLSHYDYLSIFLQLSCDVFLTVFPCLALLQRTIRYLAKLAYLPSITSPCVTTCTYNVPTVYATLDNLSLISILNSLLLTHLTLNPSLLYDTFPHRILTYLTLRDAKLPYPRTTNAHEIVNSTSQGNQIPKRRWRVSTTREIRSSFLDFFRQSPIRIHLTTLAEHLLLPPTAAAADLNETSAPASGKDNPLHRCARQLHVQRNVLSQPLLRYTAINKQTWPYRGQMKIYTRTESIRMHA